MVSYQKLKTKTKGDCAYQNVLQVTWNTKHWVKKNIFINISKGWTKNVSKLWAERYFFKQDKQSKAAKIFFLFRPNLTVAARETP